MRGFNRALHKLRLPYTKLAADETAAEKFSLPVILSRLAEKPQGYEFTLPYLANDGSEKNKQINVLWGDEGHHTICLVRCDVTDIISAEKNSRSVLQNALDLAQEANRAKTDFLSAMSHDIRTPMNAIIGMTDLALDDLDNRQHLSEYLDIIKSSSSHLLTLINDILDMSRIEKGKLKLARTSFNLSVEIDRFCSRYQLLMDKNSLNFLHNAELLHCNCIGDTAQLQRIWDNLVSNACKFTPPGGTVTFSACELPSDKSGSAGINLRSAIPVSVSTAKACSIYSILFSAAATSSASISKVPDWDLPSSKISSIIKAVRFP